ncbi:MAG: N-acetylmuramic acid/N-acetylglucosamine kinase [Fimbriimonadaceae bacterium]|nr:N-acetylmuramic acid/N-acetylglucosamine kinase [Fimbriimonadaceae bacterium]
MALVGIDAGGSKTRLVAVDTASNSVTAERMLGPGNWATSASGGWRSLIGEILADIDIDAAVICAAGIVSPQDRATATQVVKELLPTAWVRVTADFVAPLGMVPLNTVVVIAGTGSAVVRATNDGIVKLGGNGYLLGDEGSLVDIGKRAIRSYISGRGEGVSEIFGGMTPAEAIAATYQGDNPVEFLAQVGKRAVASFPKSRQVIEDAMADLAEITARLEPSERVMLTGGLWRLQPELVHVFQKGLSHCGYPGVSCEVLDDEPVMGAVKLARLLFDEHGSPKSPLLQP